MNLVQYQQVIIYARADQIVVPTNPMRDIVVVHYRAIAEPCGNYIDDYTPSVMTAYFFNTINPKDAIYVTAVHNVYGM